MSFFISDAMAEGAAPAQAGGGFEMLIFFGVFALIMYFMIIRPQSKRVKEHKNMVSALTKGDEIITNGGLLGRIMDVGDAFITIEVADNVQLNVQKTAISSIMPKGTIKSL